MKLLRFCLCHATSKLQLFNCSFIHILLYADWRKGFRWIFSMRFCPHIKVFNFTNLIDVTDTDKFAEDFCRPSSLFFFFSILDGSWKSKIIIWPKICQCGLERWDINQGKGRTWVSFVWVYAQIYFGFCTPELITFFNKHIYHVFQLPFLSYTFFNNSKHVTYLNSIVFIRNPSLTKALC